LKDRTDSAALRRVYRSGSQNGLCRLLGGAKKQGALEMGLSEHVVHLFTIEVTFEETLGNWYHVIKPIHGIQNLLTVKFSGLLDFWTSSILQCSKN
jgi:hypothetical protein